MENPVNSLVALHPRYVWFCERLQELGIPDPQLVGVHVHACILYYIPVGCYYGTLLYVIPVCMHNAQVRGYVIQEDLDLVNFQSNMQS